MRSGCEGWPGVGGACSNSRRGSTGRSRPLEGAEVPHEQWPWDRYCPPLGGEGGCGMSRRRVCLTGLGPTPSDGQGGEASSGSHDNAASQLPTYWHGLGMVDGAVPCACRHSPSTRRHSTILSLGPGSAR